MCWVGEKLIFLVCRYGKGEWSIEDARQVCAYVTGPHRLAPLLWRTARMAPRPPRGYATSTGQAISASRITTHSFQGARPPDHHSDVGVPGSQFGRFWEAPSSDACTRTGNDYGDEMSEMSGAQRRTRDYELYHQGSLSDREDRRTVDGPFPMSGAHSSPHRLGRQGLQTMHQMGALQTGISSPRSENADTGSSAASNDALVFWDDQSLQQMYLRRHDGTEYGSLSDYGGTREYNTTPEYPKRQEDDSVSHFVHDRRDAEEAGMQSLAHTPALGLCPYAQCLWIDFHLKRGWTCKDSKLASPVHCMQRHSAHYSIPSQMTHQM